MKLRRIVECDIGNTVSAVAVTRQQVSPSKVIAPAEGNFRPDEKEAQETVLELLTPFTPGPERLMHNHQADQQEENPCVVQGHTQKMQRLPQLQPLLGENSLW